MNEGKKFEQDFKNSIPADVFYYRLRDGTAGWEQGTQTRFQVSNICDAIIYNGAVMLLLELKSHKGKSIPFSCIRESQLKGLVNIDENQIKTLITGFIFNMRDVNETYFMYAWQVQRFISSGQRKSIPIAFMREHGQLIGQRLKRTRWRYNVAEWLGGK